MTMVDGQILVENGKLLNADLSELIADANQAVGPLLQRRDDWIATSGISINELEQ
jgi:5-methylthioadenosine/S-adenosylhomocysteine deaminase